MISTDVPIDLDREEAARAAAAELAKAEYRQDDEPLILRAAQWLLDRFSELLDRITGVTPGGAFGLVVLIALAVLVVVAIRLGFGPFARSSAAEEPLFVGRARSADEHRRRADDAAGRGDWSTAVTERYRAVVRSLEERGVLEPRPGRTADEAAAEAGAAFAQLSGRLRSGARAFDDIVYGGRTGDPAVDRTMRSLDDDLAQARLTASADAVSGWPVAPR